MEQEREYVTDKYIYQINGNSQNHFLTEEEIKEGRKFVGVKMDSAGVNVFGRTCNMTEDESLDWIQWVKIDNRENIILEDDLKPCPICNTKKKLVMVTHRKKNVCAIHCRNCLFNFEYISIGLSNKTEMVERWNKRPRCRKAKHTIGRITVDMTDHNKVVKKDLFVIGCNVEGESGTFYESMEKAEQAAKDMGLSLEDDGSPGFSISRIEAYLFES